MVMINWAQAVWMNAAESALHIWAKICSSRPATHGAMPVAVAASTKVVALGERLSASSKEHGLAAGVAGKGAGGAILGGVEPGHAALSGSAAGKEAAWPALVCCREALRRHG